MREVGAKMQEIRGKNQEVRAKNQEPPKGPEATPRRPVLLKVPKGLEDTLTLAMKAPFARVPSAATITEEM
jgi:hypothetical protein